MNEMNEVVKVNSLPEKYYADWCIKDCLIGKNYSNVPYKHDISKEIGECCPNYVKNDFGYGSNIYSIISEKLEMLGFVKDFFTKQGMALDEFNGFDPRELPCIWRMSSQPFGFGHSCATSLLIPMSMFIG